MTFVAHAQYDLHIPNIYTVDIDFNYLTMAF